MKIKGELTFSRELVASEIVAITAYIEANRGQQTPNMGVFPFKLMDFKALVWDERETYEVIAIIKLFIETLPKDLYINGTIKCFDEDFPEESYKLVINTNKITYYELEEDERLVKLLRCPHCQKVFKSEDFKEVYE